MDSQNFKLFLVGSGGHAISIASSLEHDGVQIDGVIDPFTNEKQFGQITIVKAFQKLPEQSLLVLAVGDNHNRESLLAEVLDESKRFELYTHISSRAIVSNSASVLEGAIVLPGSYVGPRAILGVGSLINTNSVIEHHSTVGNFASLAPGAILLGNVKVGPGAHVGPGSIVDSKVYIGQHSILGANSYLRMDLPDFVVAHGNPAVPVRDRFKGEPYLV